MERFKIIEDENGLELHLPTHRVECFACEGTGKRALHGFDVTDQVREDPDFAEDYFAGRYDTPCHGCRGTGLVNEVDEGKLSAEERKLWEEWQDQEAAYHAERAYERRMGC